jgi:hypothetical protein
MAIELDTTLLVQFARAPVPGRVKTRMLPVLSAEQACELHTELALWTCSTLVRSNLGPVHLAVTGESDHPLFEHCLDMGASAVTRQAGADLGQRMSGAFKQGLAGYPAVLLVGSDCPGIDAGYLRAAREALHRVPVVLGPAEDGGYVLIGMRSFIPRLFDDIPWGTGQVLAVTRERLVELGLEWVELEVRADIDRPEDLALWRGFSQRSLSAGS